MSKIAETAGQFKSGFDFERMLEPNWNPTNEHSACYVEPTLMNDNE
jgi:hypothetical protein